MHLQAFWKLKHHHMLQAFIYACIYLIINHLLTQKVFVKKT
jgi:hypothetical protein